MAESYIQVPPDSTGKKVRTLTQEVGGNTVNIEVKTIGDADNSSHILKVDEQGQASVRFGEGSPTMDAFGQLRIANSSILGGYEYTNGDMADLFTDELNGTGAITYVPTASETVLSVGSLVGASAVRTSNRYHYYQPGVGNLVIQTLAHGDTGKTGNIRRWGYFDESNGIFWELDGTTLSVVIRSSTSGTVTEERIQQSSWNTDKLDGSGLSLMDIDVSMANFYFLDFAWLGVGEVRMGVLSEDGSRRVCHVFKNPNNKLHPYMASGSMPVRYENFNTTGTGGTSEMRLICTAVYAESGTNYTYWRFSDIEAENVAVGDVTVPVLSMKPKLEYNGKTNRVGLYPCCVTLFVTGGSVQMSVVDDAVLTGDAWNIDCEETATGDTTATAMSGGSLFFKQFLDAGSHIIDLTTKYETNDEGYHVLADGSDAYTFTLGAKKMTGTDVRVWAVLSYRELR